MKRYTKYKTGLAMLLCLGMATRALADGVCDEEAGWTGSDTQRHFVVMAARRNVFYDNGGPAFIMLMKVDTAAQQTEMGAVGVYADEDNHKTFGAVPPRVYDRFLTEPAETARDDVMLRLEITGPQYEHVLDILRTWDRRARERALLYQDNLLLNQILFLKQATQALNRCSEAFDIYALDFGVEDEISDNNGVGLIPFLFFEELKRRNASLHVPDGDMSKDVLLLASGS